MNNQSQVSKKSNITKRGLALTASLVTLIANSYSAQGVTPPNQIWFDLSPNPQVLRCLAANPSIPPKARVLVQRGSLNDTMTVYLSGIKPGLKFDLFTLQRSPLLANGQIDPTFKNFGLAWYQTDLQANQTTSIRTILLDQIFGFDPDVNLKPTKTFHVGFWFNDPKDAQACGFDITKPTPFNGENKAGPLAFISRPNAVTKLGPLCTKPNLSTNPVSCDP
ncbi:hypothetical protein [Merismopedia glauca]|uniref:Uncharacterized protein n=1 Tax=Merismopedia glauca CCAP 1448/3 TaxID=1296344 RepID=A0A2T1C1T0_9CYAN|nr:hypothetical protein [Merismopedia glauca]PSB02229.1 hypothetical protein C7B64_14225 [Merismopedia glauca CCAP 1448/3]